MAQEHLAFAAAVIVVLGGGAGGCCSSFSTILCFGGSVCMYVCVCHFKVGSGKGRAELILICPAVDGGLLTPMVWLT